MEASDIIKKTGVNDNLFIISSGPIPPNPAELLIHERTQKLFNELKEQFDYIVIDSPPIGIVTDAQLLSIYSDLTLYIVRQKYTFKEQLGLAEALYQEKKMKNIGIVVNDIEPQKGYGNGYGYRYGFGAGYGQGYYSDDVKPEKGLIAKFKKLITRSK